ncbi:ABC transporter substrate-binding protein [Nocardioides carbamazepini]|uniref:ABC transporter substrate-binding protein n=1 Tax=Nocardioides carbamazepini TaxID=2854259 RepID=UPI0021499FA7|nr:ABC transporter substrate-binding protein [Nocardioides carbamazepini]MCR1785714.1 ABC transporter substrate-binding protein [Nocardioides carbamazepini]
MTRTIATVAGAAVLTCALSACGGGSGDGADASTDKVTLRLGAILTAKEAPYFLGIERGCFADQDIELDLAEGKGSSSTVQTVASGADEFGQADPSTMIGLAAKGAEVKAVMSYLDISPLSVLVPRDSDITDLSDLEGKKLAFTAGDSPSTLFPALAEVNDLAEDRVEMVNMNIQVKMTAILQRKVDAMLGLSFMAANLSEKGLESEPLLYADHGVNLPGDVIITSDALIEKDPDLVDRFVAATACAKEAAMEDPDAAVAAFTKANSAYPASGAEKEFALVSELFTAPADGSPVGAISEDLFRSGYDFLVAHTDVPEGKDVSTFFTNAHLPQG